MTADGLARVRGFHARAVELYNVGAPLRALRTLRQALQLLERERSIPARDRSIMAARLWISVALNESELRSLDDGRAALAIAAEHAERAAEPTVFVLLHCQRGLIELRGGNLEAALGPLDAAVELIDHAEPRDQSSIVLNRGTVALYQGRLAAARTDLRRAVAIAREAGLSIGEFKARHNLAYTEFLAGDLPGALRLMSDAVPPGLGGEWGVALLDKARVLAEAGLVREADDTLASAAVIFRRARLVQDLAEAELDRARCALVAGDVVTARRLAARARDRFRRRGNDSWRRTAELVLLQSDLAAGRPGSRLVGPARRLYAEFHEAGLDLPARTAALIAAEASLAANRPDDAAQALEGLGAPTRRDPVTSRLHHHYVHARLDRAAGRPAAARKRVRRALSELASYQASFGSIDLSTAAAVHGRHLAELDLAIALDSGRPAAVLEAAEQSRAVTSRLPAVVPPEDPQLAEMLAELRQTIEALRATEQDAGASAPLLRKRRELEKAITERGWTRVGSGSTRAAAGVPEIAAGLGDAALATFVQTDALLHAVVADRGDLRLVPLGQSARVIEHVRRVRADLDVLAQPRLPAPLRSAVHASYARSMTALDDWLLGSLGVAGRRLVLVTTGALGQLPWTDLPSRRGLPTVAAPSATAWLAAAAEPSSGEPAVTAIAGPDVGRAGDEIAGVAAAWSAATMLSGAAATGEALAKEMVRADVVHIAAHGVHQTENPLFSSLRLADGPLFAHELDRAGRAPEHVVLSACELGLATVRPGDEALGLTSVLLHLGTRSVIAGVARVGDEVAATTMTAYHRELAGGADSASALASALAANAADHPAPFVCFGASWSR